MNVDLQRSSFSEKSTKKSVRLNYRLLLMVVALLAMMLTSAAYAESSKSDPSEQKVEQISHEYLYFPKGVKATEEMVEALPSWIELNSDGTLPQRVKLPENHGIPQIISLPERVVEIPVFDEDGSIVLDRDGEVIKEKITMPPTTYDLEKALAPSELQPTSRNLGGNSHFSGGSISPYFVTVQPAWSGHCDQGVNYGKFSPSSSASNFHAGSSLSTWTPDGTAYHWDFTQQGPGVTDTTLCIPKSLYWLHIAIHLPGSTSQFWGLYSAYNSIGNWWMTYD